MEKITNFMPNAGRASAAPRAGHAERTGHGCEEETLKISGRSSLCCTPTKKFFSKLEKILNDRKKMMADETLDWASPSCSPTDRCSWRASPCASLVRMWSAAPSAIATPW